ncbi:MAG: ABC transporter ATP-binding protein [Planctomycetota bacterium]
MSALRTSGIVRLLWPHAKPHRGKLVGVFLCSMFAAVLMQSTLLLLIPAWEVMFHDPKPDVVQQVRGDLAGEMTDAQIERIAEAVTAAQQAHEAASTELDPSKAKGWLGDLKQRAREFVLGDTQDMDTERRKSLLWRVAWLVSLLAMAGGAVTYAGIWMSAKAGLGIVVSLRQELVRHLMQLSLRYHGRRQFGDLLSRMSADVGKALSVINIILVDLVQEPLSALVALGFAFAIAPQAALAVVVGLPLLLLPVSILLRKMRKGSNKSLFELGATTQAMTQIFTGIRTVKAFRAEERELERFHKVQMNYVAATMKMVRAGAMSAAWTITYTHVGMGILVLLVGYMILFGVIEGDGGALLTFFMYISAAYKSIKRTLRAQGTVAEAQGACDRLQELVDEKPDIIEPPDAYTVTGLGSGLRIEHLGFTYDGESTPALIDINLELRPGETLALVGPSGSGKSTLVDLVARFLDPNEGRILVDGHDLREVTLDSWTSQYSMVTQSPFLFHESIGGNIRYGKPGASQEEVEAAARAADIHDFIAGLPQGYRTNVADAGSRLSGGQRQRITIARAVLHGAPLLLLDEATSALDTESERAVQAALDKLMEGHTSIVIAHRLSTIQSADRIAVLSEGRLVELGTHKELLALKGLYAHLHGLQFRTEGAGGTAAPAESSAGA